MKPRAVAHVFAPAPLEPSVEMQPLLPGRGVTAPVAGLRAKIVIVDGSVGVLLS
jgi:hypothetical protein